MQAVSDTYSAYTVYVSVYSFAIKLSLDVVTAYQGTATINGTESIWITYSTSVTNPSATVTNGTLNSAASAYYYYGALLNITASGSVTIKITGEYELSSSSYDYTATNITSTETEQAAKVANQLIVSTETAAAVAALVLAQSRYTYSISERGDPARELMDTATVQDAYGVNGTGIIISEQFTYKGALSCATKAVKT